MDEQDFDRMVKQNYARIRRTALLLSNGNAWDADDLTQDTLLQAARGWLSFKGSSQGGTWLYSILINRHRQRRRSSRRIWRRCLNWFEQNSKDASDGSPESRLLAAELQGTLWSAVSSLPEPQREAVVLRYSENMTYEQIAGVLRCPIGTVKSRLHHALATLQNTLREHELENPGWNHALRTDLRSDHAR